MCKMKIMLFMLCVMLLLGLCGCDKQVIDETAEMNSFVTEMAAEDVNELPGIDIYIQAAQPLRDAKNLKVELTTEKTITVDTGDFKVVSNQELILTNIGKEDFAASMAEELEIGDYYDEFTEYYEDGVLYVNIYDVDYFKGNMTEENFLDRFAPAVLLNESLYGEISTEETEAGVTLTFSNPTGPEAWALPEGAEFMNAVGIAKVNANGTLTKTTYTIEYIQGNSVISMEITAESEIYDEEVLKAPQEITIYKEVDSIEALRLYDMAILYLCSAETASSTINQTIVSQAAGYSSSEQIMLHYDGTGQEHISDIQYTTTSLYSSYDTDTFSQTEHFQNGMYTYCEAGGEPEEDPDITPEDMLEYLQGYFSDNLPAIDFIISAESENVNGLVYLEMELDEDWGDQMCDYTSYLLFQKEEFLNDYASDYKTITATYYMVLDSAIGLPLAAGSSYTGVHTIDGIDYELSLEITQSYCLGDFSTYEKITGENLPEKEPEIQATPLFYHITGAEGQEMYLMGTIHVGDNKTAYLPDEVYDALETSDALAVETDIIAFEEEIEANPEFASQIAMTYLNSEGNTVKEQLDETVYDKAVKLLKASGNYSANMEYMIPYFWSSSIEDFYMSLSNLQSEKGLDMRLLKLAKEQNKEIREVESTQSNIEMLVGFSDELQVMLLEETIGYTVEEYFAEIQNLYDLWCTGDEAALREKLNETPQDLTDDEAALYDEYLDAMIIQRNEDMRDVAVSYLESGDTVLFAVGLAHLLQENGLVDSLREAGYTVEPITYS